MASTIIFGKNHMNLKGKFGPSLAIKMEIKVMFHWKIDCINSYWWWISLIWKYQYYCQLSFNPILRGGGAYMPPYHISAIFSRHTYQGTLKAYSKFKFCHCRTPKIGFGSKRFPYGSWEAAKVVWVVDFFAPFLPQNWL